MTIISYEVFKHWVRWANTQLFLHYTAWLLKYTHFWKSAFVTHRKGKRTWRFLIKFMWHIFIKEDMVKKIKTTYWAVNCNFYDKNVGQRIVHRVILYINEKFIKTISTCTPLGKFSSVFTCLAENQYRTPVCRNETHFLHLFSLAYLNNLGRAGVTSRCSNGSVSANIRDKTTGSYRLNGLEMI